MSQIECAGINFSSLARILQDVEQIVGSSWFYSSPEHRLTMIWAIVSLHTIRHSASTVLMQRDQEDRTS